MRHLIVLFIALVVAMLVPIPASAVVRPPDKVAKPVFMKKDVAVSQVVGGDVMRWSGH